MIRHLKDTTARVMIPRCDRFIYKLWKLPFEEIVFIGAWTHIGHRPSIPPSLPTHPHSYKKSACCFLSTCSSCYNVWLTCIIMIMLEAGGGVIWPFLIILQKYFLIKQWTYSVFVQNYIPVGRVYMYFFYFMEKKFTTR